MAFSLMEQRRTVRQYDKDFVIPKADLEKIAEAAWNAPTAMNYQEHDLIFVTDRKKLQKITDTLMEHWPQEFQNAFNTRPKDLGVTNVVSCDASCVVFFVKNERYNELWSQIDAGTVAMAIMVEAKELGYDSCCLGSVIYGDTSHVEKVLGIPKGSLALGVAIGKRRADAAPLPPREKRAKITFE